MSSQQETEGENNLQVILGSLGSSKTAQAMMQDLVSSLSLRLAESLN